MFEDVIKKEQPLKVKIQDLDWDAEKKELVVTKEYDKVIDLVDAVRETEDDISRDIAGNELWKLTTWLLSTDRYDNRYGNSVDQAIRSICHLEAQIDELADYLLKNFGEDIEEGSAVDNVIRLMKLYSNRVK